MNEQNPLLPDSSQADEHHIDELPELLPGGSMMGLAIVRCAGVLYGIDVKWVREIRPFTGTTPVYGLPAFWVGITALRGQLYAVLDLQQILFPRQAAVEKPRQIVFTAVNNFSIGLLVEEVPAVRQVNTQSITAVSTTEVPYVLGTTPDQITVLDLPGLFADPRLAAPANQTSDIEA